MANDLELAWTAFLAAQEIDDTVASYAKIRAAASLAEDTSGRAAFDGLHEAMRAGGASHRFMQLMKLLAERWAPAPSSEMTPLRVVVSGAGPIGLRAAVECALGGDEVTVIEKRFVFSRVNILLLWACTADDLINCGAKAFLPGFSSKNDILHLGTRQMQLVLLKSALLLGVQWHSA